MSEEGFNNWSQIGQALKDAQGQVVRKTAFDVQGHIQAEIGNQHLVDTGFMKNAVYVVTSEESTYGQGAEPPKDAFLLEEIPGPGDDTTAYVAAGANYTIYQNNGTTTIPAHGFFETGMDQGRAGMDQAMELINQKMKEAGH